MKVEDQRVYWVWGSMIQRCTNPKNKAFANYGGRGVTVCEEWLKSATFIKDMGARPTGGMLERRNNDAGYSKANCEWVTRKQNNSNRRNIIRVEIGGERITLKEACRRLGMTYRPVHKRIVRGWTIERALGTPIGATNAATN